MENILQEKFSIDNITIKQLSSEKNPNLLGFALLTFRGELGSHFTISSITIWKSKFGGLNVEFPKNKNFEFFLLEKSFKNRIKQEIIKKYEFHTIPVIEG